MVQDASRSESHMSMDLAYLQEKERFMNGEKIIAIISESSSSGIALHVSSALTLVHFE